LIMRQGQFDHHSRNDQIEGRNDVVELEALEKILNKRWGNNGLATV